MMDDEIVFLGSSKGPSSAQRPVTGERPPEAASWASSDDCCAGIVLHVEGQESGENYSMTFRKANTSVVHIGRRPGFESSRSQDVDQGNAMFRCAVVSRKHATIAFSDSGHVCFLGIILLYILASHFFTSPGIPHRSLFPPWHFHPEIRRQVP